MTSSLGLAYRMCLEEQGHPWYPEPSRRLRKVCSDTTDGPFHLGSPRKDKATVLRIRSHSNALNAQIYRYARSVQICKQLQTASHERRPAADRPWARREGPQLQQQSDLCRVQIRGRRRTQPSNLLVPVKCAQTLMNWHCCIPLPHSHYRHYTGSDHFYTPSRTFHFPAVLNRRAIKKPQPHPKTPHLLIMRSH